MFYFNYVKNKLEPKKLVAKFTFGKQGRELGEFTFPSSIAIKGDYLFVGEYSYIGNSRIQILKINPAGSLSPKFTFGREGASLGEFKERRFVCMECRHATIDAIDCCW